MQSRTTLRSPRTQSSDKRVVSLWVAVMMAGLAALATGAWVSTVDGSIATPRVLEGWAHPSSFDGTAIAFNPDRPDFITSEEFLSGSSPAGTYLIGPATNSISIDNVNSESSPSCVGDQRDAHTPEEIDALWTRVRMGVVEIDYQAEGGQRFHVAWIRCLGG